MKSKFYLPLIAMAIGMGSCTNDLVDETSPLMGKRDVIAVSVDNADTRTAMNGNNVVWSTGDAIGIFVGSTNNEYGLISEPGITSGDFQSKGLVVASAETLKEAAYFPYVQDATWDSSTETITTSLPATYEYAEGTNNNAVMAALMAGDAQSSISFQNAGALYAITVKNIPEGYDKAVMTYLNAEDNVGIAGAATITFNNGVPTLAVPEAASAQKTITITFSDNGDKTFYFPMPVKASGYANKLQFSLQGDNKDAIKAPVFTQEPVRSNLYAVTLKLDAVSGGIVSEANDIEAANAALANDAVTSVAVKDVSGTEPITIPAKSESADVPHTIDLSKAELPTGDNKLTINVDNTTDNTTVKELTVVVPDEETAGNLVIYAPGTTVTIQSANGTVIETIEATTAENTLIIGEGVTIKKLVVMGGNVVLKGNVKNIESDVETTITLDEDITLAESIVFSKGDVTVNLNGKEIKCASSDVFVVTDGTLTIDGEGLVYGSEANEGNSCAVWVNGANAKAIIKNGTYKVGGDIKGTTDQRNDCIYVGRDGGTIEIYGGVFEYTGEVKDGSINDGSRFLVNQNNDNATQLITIYGGTFHNFDPANAKTDEPWMTDGVGSFVAAGYSSVAGENDTYVVNEGILNEVALKAAIAAGKTEVTLGDDIVLSDAITISNDLTLDLGGNTLSMVDNNLDKTNYAVVLVKKGNVVIENGTIATAGTANHIKFGAVWAYGSEQATVTIKEGTTLKGNNWNTGALENQNSCIATVYVSNPNCTITIEGGEFYCVNQEQPAGQNQILNILEKEGELMGDIVVKGGKFHRMNPEIGNGKLDGSYVAAGYSSVAGENNTYVVKEGICNETALKAAIAAGKAEVTLDSDITLTDAITIDKDITLDLGGNTLSMVDDNLGKTNYAVVLVKKGNVVIQNGTIATAGTANHIKFGAVWAYGSEEATVTIKEGTTLKGNNWNTGALENQNSCIATVYVSNPNCTITIEGGEFYCVNQEQSEGQNQILNILEKDDELKGKIVVKGGKFYGMDPAIGNGTLDGSYVAEGYVSTLKDGYYVVTKQN